MFDAIVETVEGFGEIFRSIGDAFSQVFKEMGYSAGDWGGAFKIAIDGAVLGISC